MASGITAVRVYVVDIAEALGELTDPQVPNKGNRLGPLIGCLLSAAQALQHIQYGKSERAMQGLSANPVPQA